jgi:hypothetical protein
MKTILVFLLSATVCLGQMMPFASPAFVGQAGNRAVSASTPSVNPTNIVGYPAISWWKGSDWYTNSGEYWPDRGPGGYTLSQSTASAGITNSTMDSQGFVRFTGADYSYMSSSTYTSSQPHTLVYLIRFKQPSSASSPTLIIGKTSDEYTYTRGSTRGVALDGGSYNTGMDGLWTSNVWCVVETVWNGSSSQVYTNGVIVNTGNAGTATANGLNILASSDFTGQTVADLAEICTYKTNFSTGARASLYNYFKTNYPSASLP